MNQSKANERTAQRALASVLDKKVKMINETYHDLQIGNGAKVEIKSCFQAERYGNMALEIWQYLSIKGERVKKRPAWFQQSKEGYYGFFLGNDKDCFFVVGKQELFDYIVKHKDSFDITELPAFLVNQNTHMPYGGDYNDSDCIQAPAAQVFQDLKCTVCHKVKNRWVKELSEEGHTHERLGRFEKQPADEWTQEKSDDLYQRIEADRIERERLSAATEQPF